MPGSSVTRSSKLLGLLGVALSGNTNAREEGGGLVCN